MPGIPRILTHCLREIPRILRISEPRLNRSEIEISLQISLVFILAVIAVPALLPNDALIRLIACGTLAWGFSEFYTRKNGLAAPSVLFSATLAQCFFLAGLFLIPGIELIERIPSLTDAITHHSGPMALVCLTTAMGMIGHYALVRSPIDLGFAAIGLTGFIVMTGYVVAPEIMAIGAHFVTAGCAWITLCTAVVFDISDPKRQTRATDIAYWLHLAAALILAYAIIRSEGQGREITAFLALSLFAMVGTAVNRYAILTVAQFCLVVLLAGAVSTGHPQITVITLIALGIVSYAQTYRKDIRRRLIERTLPDLAAILPPLDDESR